MYQKSICDYKEFDCKSDYPSVKTSIGFRNENSNVILTYLKKFEPVVAVTRPIIDYISGEQQKESVFGYTDGVYWWTNEEVYHFEKYGLKLNDSFIRHVLEHSLH